MPPSEQSRSPLFIKLPPELRLAMYKAALDLDTNDGFAFLQTCQAINTEAQETLYQRTATFTSQADFSAWVERSHSAGNYLAYVKNLRLTLTDIDLSPLMDPRAFYDARRRTTVSILCDNELRKMQHSIFMLPHLANLTIVPPLRAQPAFWEAVYRPLLASLPRMCPQLRHLELHDSEELLELVPALTEVAKVTFLRSMPRPTLEAIDERRKSSSRVAAVEFDFLLGMVNEGRRAASAPVLGRPSATAPWYG